MSQILSAFHNAHFSLADQPILQNPLAFRLIQILQVIVDYLIHCQTELQEQLQESTKNANFYFKNVQDMKTKFQKLQSQNSQMKNFEKCPICQKLFDSALSLDGHINRRHPNLQVQWAQIRNKSCFDDEQQDEIKKLKEEISILRKNIKQQDSVSDKISIRKQFEAFVFECVDIPPLKSFSNLASQDSIPEELISNKKSNSPDLNQENDNQIANLNENNAETTEHSLTHVFNRHSKSSKKNEDINDKSDIKDKSSKTLNCYQFDPSPFEPIDIKSHLQNYNIENPIIPSKLQQRASHFLYNDSKTIHVTNSFDQKKEEELQIAIARIENLVSKQAEEMKQKRKNKINKKKTKKEPKANWKTSKRKITPSLIHTNFNDLQGDLPYFVYVPNEEPTFSIIQQYRKQKNLKNDEKTNFKNIKNPEGSSSSSYSQTDKIEEEEEIHSDIELTSACMIDTSDIAEYSNQFENSPQKNCDDKEKTFVDVKEVSISGIYGKQERKEGKSEKTKHHNSTKKKIIFSDISSSSKEKVKKTQDNLTKVPKAKSIIAEKEKSDDGNFHSKEKSNTKIINDQSLESSNISLPKKEKSSESSVLSSKHQKEKAGESQVKFSKPAAPKSQMVDEFSEISSVNLKNDENQDVKTRLQNNNEFSEKSLDESTKMEKGLKKEKEKSSNKLSDSEWQSSNGVKKQEDEFTDIGSSIQFQSHDERSEKKEDLTIKHKEKIDKEIKKGDKENSNLKDAMDNKVTLKEKDSTNFKKLFNQEIDDIDFLFD